jgi:hypothetical protein
MERNRQRLTRKAYYARKIKQAAHLLLYRHHIKPGVKGWELRRKLGSDYPTVLEILSTHLEKLGLQIKIIFDEEKTVQDPTLDQLENARFYITLRGEIESEEAKLMGWRIDDIAGLALAISFIISKKGKAPRKDVVELLSNKLPGWRVNMNIRRYIRSGYLSEGEDGNLFLDWRTRAEVDETTLVNLLTTANLRQEP